MALNPPLCLEVYYTTAGGADIPGSPNLYHFNFAVTPQRYSTGQYDGTNLQVGMFTTNNFDGYIFRIYSIINQSPTNVELYLEDIDGYNARIDPSQGVAGGGPLNDSPGYVFQVNGQGFPVLNSVDTAPSITFTDSILARFLYFQSNNAPTGDTGARGPPGASVIVKGSVATSANLPLTGNQQNDAYITLNTGRLWVWSGIVWVDVGPFVGPIGATGNTGNTGARGLPGASIVVKGSVPASSNLPLTGNQQNDAYVTLNTGHLWIWTGTTWLDIGPFVGPKGDTGFTGFTGPAGSAATTGSTGVIGFTGSTGIQGASVIIKGSVATSANLPLTGNQQNDAYVTLNTGNLWVWTGIAWLDVGPFVGPIGATGDTGNIGERGPQGASVIIKGSVATSGDLPFAGNQQNDGYVTLDTGHLWVWTGLTWLDVGPFVGPIGATGNTGNTGERGPQGASVIIKGSVATSGDLPLTGNQQNDGYVTTDTGHLWVWTGLTWLDVGPFVGPIGATGATGAVQQVVAGTTGYMLISDQLNGGTISTTSLLEVHDYGPNGEGGTGVTGINIKISANLIPEGQRIYNLGSEDHPFGTLYVASQTINLGGASLGVLGGQLSFSPANSSAPPIQIGAPNLSDNFIVTTSGGTSAGALSSLFYSFDGVNYKPCNSPLYASTLVAWNGAIWAATGNIEILGGLSGGIATSPDGINWTLSDTTGLFPGVPAYAIAFGNSIWVACGGADIAYSSEGISWTRSPTSVLDNAFALSYNGIIWLVGGAGASNQLATSVDGIYWTAQPQPTLGFALIYDISWNGKYWILVGDGGAAYSDDGFNWTKITLPGYAPGVMIGVAWNGTTWLISGISASSSDPIVLYYSTFGQIDTWNLISATFPPNLTGFGKLGWNGSQWNIVTGNTIIYSTDLINWIAVQPDNVLVAGGFGIASRRILPYVGTNNPISVNGGGGSTPVSFIGGSITGELSYSYNGVSWIESTSASKIFTTKINATAWNGFRWVAVGEGTSSIAYSDDANTWTKSTNPFSISCSAVCWGKGQWLAAGTTDTDGTFFSTSTDGITWTAGSDKVFTSVSAIANDGKIYIAVGSGTNSMMSSTDGITWSPVASANSLLTSVIEGYGGLAIAYNGTIWVASGFLTDNLLIYSYDGITWYASESGNLLLGMNPAGYGNARSFAWNGILWITTGVSLASFSYQGLVAYSYDGITWYQSDSSLPLIGIDAFGYSVAWNGTIFVCGSTSPNRVIYSIDGIYWLSSTSANIFFTSAVHTVSSNLVLPYIAVKNGGGGGGGGTGATGATGGGSGGGVMKSLPSLSYYISENIPVQTAEIVPVIYNTLDPDNSSGQTDFTYDPVTGILENPTSDTITVLVSGQLQTDNDSIDITTDQPCIYVVKNTNNIVSSSVLNFQGSSFSTAIILASGDKITILFAQYFQNTVNILGGQFTTRITYTQLDNVQGPTGATGPGAIIKSMPSLSYYISANIPVQTGETVSVIYDTFDSNNSTGQTDFTYDLVTGILRNPTTDTLTVMVSGQLQTDNDIIDITTDQPCIYVVKNTNNIVSSSVLNFQGSSFSTAIILEPGDQITILFAQYFQNTINILSGRFITRITYTQMDTVQGPTGATGPAGQASDTGSTGVTGPTGRVVYAAIVFDGGDSMSAYPFGPAFDCGTSI
jgi:hypothetical protein